MPPEDDINVITYRLGAIEDAISTVSKSMQQLVILEQKHIETREALGRAFDNIEDHDARIKKIEIELPTLTLTRGWILSGVITIVSLVVLAALGLKFFK